MHHTVAAEARRLFDKYRGTAALKALYPAKAEGDFYHRVSARIAELEHREGLPARPEKAAAVER